MASRWKGQILVKEGEDALSIEVGTAPYCCGSVIAYNLNCSDGLRMWSAFSIYADVMKKRIRLYKLLFAKLQQGRFSVTHTSDISTTQEITRSSVVLWDAIGGEDIHYKPSIWEMLHGREDVYMSPPVDNPNSEHNIATFVINCRNDVRAGRAEVEVPRINWSKGEGSVLVPAYLKEENN